jgi:hypothetical protein
MSKSRSESGADLNDYKFWRSQHRHDEQDKTSGQTFVDAIFNRAGEETGQSLHRLIWPRIPQGWKNLTSALGGLIPILPVLQAARKGAGRMVDRFEEKTSYPRQLCAKIEVEIDGTKVAPDGGKVLDLFAKSRDKGSSIRDMGDLFERINSAKYYWAIRIVAAAAGDQQHLPRKDDPSIVIKYDVDGTSKDAGQLPGENPPGRGGVFQVEGTTVEAAGVKLEAGIKKPDLLVSERFELVKQFLRDQFWNQFSREWIQYLLKNEESKRRLERIKEQGPVDEDDIAYQVLCQEYPKFVRQSIYSAF